MNHVSLDCSHILQPRNLSLLPSWAWVQMSKGDLQKSYHSSNFSMRIFEVLTWKIDNESVEHELAAPLRIAVLMISLLPQSNAFAVSQLPASLATTSHDKSCNPKLNLLGILSTESQQLSGALP